MQNYNFEPIRGGSGGGGGDSDGQSYYFAQPNLSQQGQENQEEESYGQVVPSQIQRIPDLLLGGRSNIYNYPNTACLQQHTSNTIPLCGRNTQNTNLSPNAVQKHQTDMIENNAFLSAQNIVSESHFNQPQMAQYNHQHLINMVNDNNLVQKLNCPLVIKKEKDVENNNEPMDKPHRKRYYRHRYNVMHRHRLRPGGESGNLADFNLDNLDQRKLERKRELNRIAATKCRQRKLERIMTLEQTVSELKADNAMLCHLAQRLRLDNSRLEVQINNHIRQGCQLGYTQSIMLDNAATAPAISPNILTSSNNHQIIEIQENNLRIRTNAPPDDDTNQRCYALGNENILHPYQDDENSDFLMQNLTNSDLSDNQSNASNKNINNNQTSTMPQIF